MFNMLRTQWASILTLLLVGLNTLLLIILAFIIYFTINDSKVSLNEESLQSIVEIYKEWPDENHHYFNCNEFNPDFYNGLLRK